MTSDEQKIKNILKVIKSVEYKLSTDNMLMGVLYDERKGEIIFEYHSGEDVKVAIPKDSKWKRNFMTVIKIYRRIKSLFNNRRS